MNGCDGVTGTSARCGRLCHNSIGESIMSSEPKREFWIITLTTLAAAPLVGGLGFAAVTGLIGM